MFDFGKPLILAVAVAISASAIFASSARLREHLSLPRRLQGRNLCGAMGQRSGRSGAGLFPHRDRRSQSGPLDL